MNAKLTKRDLTDLIDAVEEWERAIDRNASMGEMLCMMLTSGDQKTKQSVKEEIRSLRDEEEPKKRARTERSIILRAKLLMLRDATEAEDLIRDTNH